MKYNTHLGHINFRNTRLRNIWGYSICGEGVQKIKKIFRKTSFGGKVLASKNNYVSREIYFKKVWFFFVWIGLGLVKVTINFCIFIIYKLLFFKVYNFSFGYFMRIDWSLIFMFCQNRCTTICNCWCFILFYFWQRFILIRGSTFCVRQSRDRAYQSFGQCQE